MLRNIAAVAVCAAASALLVSAQSAPTSSTAKPCPALPTRIDALPATTKTPSEDTLSLLKKALANEWLSAKSAQNALSALQFLTVGVPRTPVADELVAAKRRLQNLIALDPDADRKKIYKTVLDELAKIKPPEPAGNSSDPGEAARHSLQSLLDGDSDAKNQDLYRFGLGDLQAEGTPDYAGISAFLDYLSEANTLNFSTPGNEHDLFDSVDSLLNVIAPSSGGRQKLKVVQDSFARKDKHVALYQLLSAVPADPGSCDYSYPNVLEIFRAAYAMNSDKLAKAVAAINAPSK